VNKEELIKKIDDLMPDQLKDGTFAESDYQVAEGLYRAIETIEQSLSGHVIVPEEPKMYQVFAGEAQFKQNRYSRDQLVNAYKAMLSAAKGE